MPAQSAEQDDNHGVRRNGSTIPGASPADRYQCRACKANEHGAGQTLCDECETQLEGELDRRAIRSWDELMEAWKGSVPESYANYVALSGDDSIQGLESVKQHAESLGQLLSRDPILYYAQLKMIEDHGRSADARFGSSFAASPRAATEPHAVSMSESTPLVSLAAAQLRAPQVSFDYDIPAGYPADWHELRRMVYRRDNYTCQDRGETNMLVVAHHIVPLWDGGSNELSNLVTLCESCHDRRHVVISTERRELRMHPRRSEFRWDTQTVVAVIVVALVAAWFIAYVLTR